MNMANFKLSLVRILVGEHIEDVPRPPKELTHQLIRIYMDNTARHLCAYCALFSKEKRTR